MQKGPQHRLDGRGKADSVVLSVAGLLPHQPLELVACRRACVSSMIIATLSSIAPYSPCGSMLTPFSSDVSAFPRLHRGLRMLTERERERERERELYYRGDSIMENPCRRPLTGKPCPPRPGPQLSNESCLRARALPADLRAAASCEAKTCALVCRSSNHSGLQNSQRRRLGNRGLT